VNLLGIPSIILIIFLGEITFFIFVTLVSILSLREFFLLGKYQKIYPQFIFGYIVTFFIILQYYFGLGHPLTIFRHGEMLLLFTPIIVLAELFRGKPNALSNILFTLAGILYIPLLLGSMVALRQIDPVVPDMGMKLTFCLFCGVWICDSAAYVVGRFFGKRKILVNVSPRKTVAGGIAGLTATFIFFIILMETDAIASRYTSLNYIDFLVFSIVIGIFGQAGDFAESLIKRDIGVKDTSNLLAGHGGILDRFDSLIIASPLMFLYANNFIY
tara:strand:+ start:5241 stop:6056 length:816 start_codon:yes stop_codon:yes gene_type:complete